MKKLTHIASKDRQCFTCTAVIRTGDKYRQYRERATSSHEARHGGMYPIRHQCAACASMLPTPVEGNGGTVGRAIAETTRMNCVYCGDPKRDCRCGMVHASC